MAFRYQRLDAVAYQLAEVVISKHLMKCVIGEQDTAVLVDKQHGISCGIEKRTRVQTFERIVQLLAPGFIEISDRLSLRLLAYQEQEV